MSDSRTSSGYPASFESNLPAFAAGAMALWVVLEFAIRRGLGPRLADPLGSGVGAAALMLAVGFPVIAGGVAWAGLRAGITPGDWDYDVSVRSVGMGLAGVVAFFVVYAAVTTVYTSVLGVEPSVDASSLGFGGAPAWALALFLVGNGIVVPIAEELAWRGVVQTALAEAYGVSLAVGVTTVAFVLKHLVVDLSAPLFRVTSLLLLSFVFCALRARYGTASSTVAHLAANFTATASLVLL